MGNCRNGGDGLCSQPPTFKYLSSGFVMGPPKMIHTAYDFACKKIARSNGRSEQVYLHEFFVSHPRTTCLDYSGGPMLNLHQFKTEEGQQIFRAEKGQIVNTVAQNTECFVHGNGDGKDLVTIIAKLVT